MTLKNAGFLALIGTLLLTVQLAADFIRIATAYFRDVVPAMDFLRSLIYLFAALTATIFFYTFFRSRSQ